MKALYFFQAIPEFCDVTLDSNETKKCLLLHNLDPMFNIRYVFTGKSEPTLITKDSFTIFFWLAWKKTRYCPVRGYKSIRRVPEKYIKHG